LGEPLKQMSASQLQDLLKIKQTLGIPDPRFGLKECELCNNDEWRPGVMIATPPQEREAAPNKDAEALVQAITEQILAKMKQG
jgi:L-fuculose-phosphate aldolase